MEQLQAMSPEAARPRPIEPAERPEPPVAATASAPALRVKLEIRDVSFFYGTFKALKNISLPLYDRRVTAFIGPSGCGKSTLLRVLNRIYELYPGQVATDRAGLAAAVAALGPVGSPDRELWRLLFVEDRPVAEVARRLRVPEGTVKSRAFRVRRLLRVALGQGDV